MSDDADDWKRQFREMSEANAQMLAKLKEMRLLQAKFDETRPIESFSNKQDPNKFNELLIQIINEQNQFHERLLSKLDEIVNALKK